MREKPASQLQQSQDPFLIPSLGPQALYEDQGSWLPVVVTDLESTFQRRKEGSGWGIPPLLTCDGLATNERDSLKALPHPGQCHWF